jgi:transketolase
MKQLLKNQEKIPTRNAYGQALVELGKVNPNVVVFEADIAKSTQTHLFAKEFPERFFNVGVAEQNEMAIAAGAATCGKIAFVSTYAVFASMRACEQMRTSVAYPKLNVKIAVSHGGVTAYDDGVTHQATEDLGIVRTIPNMTVVMPADAHSARKAVFEAAKLDGPVYIRFMRIGMPVIYSKDVDFTIGKAIQLRQGKDATIVAIGDMVCQAIQASEELASQGIEADVFDMHTIKPLDKEALLESAMRTGAVVTVEDHNIINALGSAVSEVLAEEYPVRVHRIGLRDTFAESGAYDELLAHYGMDSAHIVEAAKKVIRHKD